MQRLYWDIELVSASAASPYTGDSPSLPARFLADGSVIFQDQPTRRVRIRKPNGETSDVPLPSNPVAGGLPLGGPEITWYADAKNYGGASIANGQTLGGGWVSLDSVVHENEVSAGIPVFRNPDGSFVTRDDGGKYWMTWKPGQNPAPKYPMVDALDIHDNKLDLVMPCFSPQQVGADGSILVRFDVHGQLYCKNNEGDLPRFQLLRDFQKVDISKQQFNLGWAVELNTCCDIWGINNVGQILGLRYGIPAIQTGTSFTSIGEERGTVSAFNDVGDVLMVTGDPAIPRLRWHGKTRDFLDCEVTKQLDAKLTTNPLLSHALAMANDGKVLFWGDPAQGVAGVPLYLATPRIQQIPDGVVGKLDFTLKSGSGKAPGAFAAWKVWGQFTPGSLSLSLRAPGQNTCADRFFSVTATRTTGDWQSGDLIPATSSYVPGMGTVLGIVSYSDATANAIAGAGGFRVTEVTAHGFTATAEGLVLKNVQTGATFKVAGRVVVVR